MDELAYKTAAIDWLLTLAEVDKPWASTDEVLFDLADRGIDYAASTMPDFGTATFDSGDTETEATYGRALVAEVVPIDAKQVPRYSYGSGTETESYTFFIRGEDLQAAVMAHVIRGIITSADTGTQGWTSRFPRERERYDARKAQEAERQAARQAAWEAQQAKKDTARDAEHA